MVRVWDQLDLLYLKKHYTFLDNKILADHLVRSSQAVRNKACQLGLKKPTPTINEGYFEYINTPEQAYWLGLLWADGSVWQRPGCDSYTLKLELQLRDAELIDDFANAIDSFIRPRRTKQNTYRLDIHNYYLCQDLIDHGIVPDKTHSSSFPVCKQDIMPDFLRGVFDGDGSVWLEQKSLGFNIAGNRALCMFVKNYFGFGSVSCCGNKNQTHMWRSCGKNVVQKFYDTIYYNDDVPCLKRKRHIFETRLGK